jgi:protein-S-isoprenylcysteine O-methyltransferase Ste14
MDAGTVAALLAVLGLGMEAWAVLTLGWRRWLDLTDAPPDAALPPLVFAGPFSHVRHPQSLGLLLLLAAAALWWHSPGMWLLALCSVAVVLALAQRDEREVARRFGVAYQRYQRAVPFIVPFAG